VVNFREPIIHTVTNVGDMALWNSFSSSSRSAHRADAQKTAKRREMR